MLPHGSGRGRQRENERERRQGGHQPQQQQQQRPVASASSHAGFFFSGGICFIFESGRAEAVGKCSSFRGCEYGWWPHAASAVQLRVISLQILGQVCALAVTLILGSSALSEDSRHNIRGSWVVPWCQTHTQAGLWLRSAAAHLDYARSSYIRSHQQRLPACCRGGRRVSLSLGTSAWCTCVCTNARKCTHSLTLIMCTAGVCASPLCLSPAVSCVSLFVPPSCFFPGRRSGPGTHEEKGQGRRSGGSSPMNPRRVCAVLVGALFDGMGPSTSSTIARCVQQTFCRAGDCRAKYRDRTRPCS